MNSVSAKDNHWGWGWSVCRRKALLVCMKSCTANQVQNSQQINVHGLAQDKHCVGKSVGWTGLLVSV